MSSFRELTTDDHRIREVAIELTRIYERARGESLALLESQPSQRIIPPVREWMSATQLAEYWQLYNDKSEPTTAGILKWSKRPQDQFHFRMLTWVTFFDSTELRWTYGQKKRPKGDEFKTKSGA
ncbi:MAG TPA: hypothetical protein VIX17_01645 [Pyrinomonadaceae bacterium]